MVSVAQLVRAPGCGPGGHRFETGHAPHGFLAQLVERQTEDLRVPGSIPGEPTTYGRMPESGQMGRTVNPLPKGCVGSNPTSPTILYPYPFGDTKRVFCEPRRFCADSTPIWSAAAPRRGGILFRDTELPDNLLRVLKHGYQEVSFFFGAITKDVKMCTEIRRLLFDKNISKNIVCCYS